MATHNATFTTTPEQEVELQAILAEQGVTIDQLVQANSDSILNAAYNNRAALWFNNLTAEQRRAIYDAAQV